VAADRAIAEGPGLGDRPLLYVHGGDDQLVPVGLARPVVERVAGPDSDLRVLTDARHEVFNELGKEETIALVASFAERVTLWPSLGRPSDEGAVGIQTDLLLSCDALLTGRRTYEGFAPVGYHLTDATALSDGTVILSYRIDGTLAEDT